MLGDEDKIALEAVLEIEDKIALEAALEVEGEVATAMQQRQISPAHLKHVVYAGICSSYPVQPRSHRVPLPLQGGGQGLHTHH